MEIAELIDRLEIQDLLARYARGVDTKDWALWRTVFTPDAHIDYRSAGGIEGDREAVAKWLEESLAAFPMTQHFITNIECELDGDTAKVRAMFYNPMRFPGSEALAYCGGYYHHQLIRTPEGWRSKDLLEDNAWFANAPTEALQQ
jgi:SnoaL-like domain